MGNEWPRERQHTVWTDKEKSRGEGGRKREREIEGERERKKDWEESGREERETYNI